MPSKTELVAIIIGLSGGTLASLSFNILGENTLDAMKSIIVADTALVGFLSVVVTFILTTLQSKKRLAEYKIHRLEKSYVEYQKKRPNEDISHETEYSKLRKALASSFFRESIIIGFASFVSTWSLISAAFLILSIEGAFLGMTWNWLLRYLGIFLTFFGMIMGIAAIFLTINKYKDVQFEPKYPLQWK
jgi:hypothetical protein